MVFQTGKHISEVEAVCHFLGQPRSGGTLIGALLNAHRHAVIAHELHALDYLKRGYTEAEIFGAILDRDRWFRRRCWQWSGYDYQVPGQWQGRFDRLRVIGDKRGHDTAILLADEPSLLDRARETYRGRLRFVHALRNPFDGIATRQARNPVKRSLEETIERYFRASAATRAVRDRLTPGELLVVRHEDLVEKPTRQLSRLCEFLGLQVADDYLEACRSRIREAPNRSRHRAEWTDALIERVRRRISEYEFYRGYDFDT